MNINFRGFLKLEHRRIEIIFDEITCGVLVVNLVGPVGPEVLHVCSLLVEEQTEMLQLGVLVQQALLFGLQVPQLLLVAGNLEKNTRNVRNCLL